MTASSQVQTSSTVNQTSGIHAVSASFQIALRKFQNRLSGKDLTDFKNTTYATLCLDIALLQHEQENLKSMMNLSRIQSCIEAMNQFGKVIEIFLNVSDVVAFVWGPIKLLLLTASTFADSFETILEAYEQIGEHLPLLQEYESLFHSNPHMVKALESMYLDILEFHQHAIRFVTGKLWKRFFKSMWKDFGTKFNGILKKLLHHKKLVEDRATLTQYRRYQEDMTDMKSKLDEIVIEETNKKRREVKEWLAVDSPPEFDHDAYRETRGDYPGTGDWIAEHETIKSWLDADNPPRPLLWMTGIPGAGKTILASVVIEQCKLRKEFLTSYYYCHYNEAKGNAMVGVLKGLADQLLDQHSQLLPHCHTRRTKSGEPSLRSFTVAKKLLEDFCIDIPKQFIVIDGLDEYEAAERKQVLEFFVQLVKQCDEDEPGKLRILIVSQDYADIKRAIHSSTIPRIAPKIISLSSSDNKDDIHTFVKAWVDKIKRKHSLSDEQGDYLLKLTVVKADGMFLYAKLVMSNLYAQPTRGNLLDAIKARNFPNGLEQAYERIVTRIKQTSSTQEWEKAKRLLGWMVCAKRQLTWKEIQVALSIEVEDQTIEYSDRHMRTHIYDICGSLVLLSRGRVQLVHSTAKHYITRCTRDIHEPSVECDLAALCLRYLTFPCFQHNENIVKKDELRQLALEGQLAFQDYAVAKWFHHVNAFVGSGKELLKIESEIRQNLPEIPEQRSPLEEMAIALENFTKQYSDEEWDDPKNIVDDCKENCKIFEDQDFYDDLVAVTSHIYKFQKKGFNARHIVSIKGLAKALDRNRSLLEEISLDPQEKITFEQFYDNERKFKCPKITCMYFSEGFKDAKIKKKHVNIHERPFQCEVLDCLAAEYGFTSSNDLEKHTRSFHPEMSDLAQSFNTAPAKREKSAFFCTLCSKSFTRNFHLQHHIMSHQGIKKHPCLECGRAFTRANDLRRHQKLHDR